MNETRPSLLISSVGWINILIGLAFVGIGVYVLIDGANAVATLLQISNDAGHAANRVPGLDPANAKKVGEGADFLAKGLSGIILAMVGVIAGCAIVQGLPVLLVGVGVLFRSNAARIFAILFAILALLEGLACVGSTGQSSRFLYIGLGLLGYAVVSFVGLFGKRASFEFSGGLKRVPESMPNPSTGDAMTLPNAPSRPASQPAVVIVLMVLLVAVSATAAVLGTLYFTSRPGLIAQNTDPKKDDKTKPATAIDDTKALAQHKPRLAAFHDAVLAGRIPDAAAMLKDVDVDEGDEQQRTALMKAAAKGNIRTTMFLLAMGAQLNQRDNEGATPLMYAADNGQVGVMEVFFGLGNALPEIDDVRLQYKPAAKIGLNLDLKAIVPAKFAMPAFDNIARDKQGRSAYSRAMLKNQLAAASFLSLRSATDDLNDADGNSLVHLLAAAGNTSVVKKLLLSSPGNVNSWYFGGTRLSTEFSLNHAQQTAWMIAAEKGHLDIVQHLLANPTLVELNRKDKTGKTGLDLATAGKHNEVIEYLAKHQEKLIPKSVKKEEPKVVKGQTKEEIDAKLKADKAADELKSKLEREAKEAKEKAIVEDKQFRADVFKFAESGDHEGLLGVLGARPGIFEANENDKTALMVAAGKGHHRVVLLLTNHLTKKEWHEYFQRTDKDGRNALMHAAAEGKTEAADHLFTTLDHQWRIARFNWLEFLDRKDKSGKNAAELAEEKGHKETAKAIRGYYDQLLDSRSPGFKNRTALEVASENGQLGVVEKLLKRKAKLLPDKVNSGHLSSALSLAARNGHILVVESLLLSIADPKERAAHIGLAYYDQRENLFGTLLEQNSFKLNPEVASLLKKHGPK